MQLEDAGQYRCVATNIGSRLKSREAMLTVNQGTQTASDKTITLVAKSSQCCSSFDILFFFQGAGPTPRQRPRIIARPQNVTVSVHQTVVLECVATGNPSPIISWSRADSKPIDVYNAKVLGNGNLIIIDVSSKHSGIYLCRATTPGTRNYTIAAANVTVLGTVNLLRSLFVYFISITVNAFCIQKIHQPLLVEKVLHDTRFVS